MQPLDFPYWDNTRTQPNGQVKTAIATNTIQPPPMAELNVPQHQTTAIAQAKPVTISISTDAAKIDITITPQ